MRTKGWLIERVNSADGKWWTGNGAQFTNDSVNALQMVRQRDADVLIYGHTCLGGCVATEHVWSD